MLMAVNEEILPVPLAGSPIDGILLTQVNVPAVPIKLTGGARRAIGNSLAGWLVYICRGTYYCSS